jgi:hypothetical protein
MTIPRISYEEWKGKKRWTAEPAEMSVCSAFSQCFGPRNRSARDAAPSDSGSSGVLLLLLPVS